jgi:uncharacterized lipoprotein YddW (UPF0748 family)
MVREGVTAFAFAIVLGAASCRPANAPANDEPPPAPREFRAAWVSTVANIDWPSRPGLPVPEQKAEIERIVERAAELHLNALVLQVRPSADAIYPSTLEPWSEYLTGEQGKAPDPPYDPLATWVDAAHARGLELHAWFNPYRARHKDAKSPPAPNHIARTHPDVVKSYDDYLWMDPGEPLAADRTLEVILDVVRRYDVDGVHIDDYFYPYPIPMPRPPAPPPCAGIDEVEPPAPVPDQDFPDEPSWQAYLGKGGTLAREDWRRKNVSDLIERIYRGVHAEKRFIKSGISPFGLGRPARRPPGITGFSQYDKLYADVELWLEHGWLDYLSPQLYWRVEQKGQPFGPLLDYWLHVNPQHRHVWPGLFTSRIDASAKSWPAEEVLSQILLDRDRPDAHGQVHFSMVSLLQNRRGIADRLKDGVYRMPALVPASPWLDATPPASPRAAIERTGDRVHVYITAPAGKPVSRYALWARTKGEWRFIVVPAASPSLDLDGDSDAVVVSAVDRAGNESPRVRAGEHGGEAK